MYFKVSWDQDFADLMMHLWAKYGREVFTQNGIGDQLDLNKFSKTFFTNNTTTADVSIDDNANVSGKSIIDYNFEFSKPLQKYNSHYLIWKELKKNYGLLEANSIIEKQISGEIYINDFTNCAIPYCFNYSTYDIALSGLPMAGRMKITAPKSLESFIRQMEQFTVYAANSTLGATGLADVLIVASYYVDKIRATDYDGHIKVQYGQLKTYISEKLRSFIYTLNWQFRGNQSPFTNISIYDDYFLKDLIKDYIFEDGKSPDMNTVKIVQSIFVEAMNEELKRTDLTFPVVTACFYTKDGEIQDKEFLEYIAEQNLDFGFINIYYGDSSTLSSCCFHGDQMCLSKSSNGVNFMTFRELYDSSYNDTKKNFTIFHNGSWIKGRTIKLPRDNKEVYKIITTNNKELILTEDHINVCIDKDKTTKELTTNDYLAFNTRKLDTFPEQDKKLTYNQGYLIGAYLGDGSKYKVKTCNSWAVFFSISQTKLEVYNKLLKALDDWGIEEELHKRDEKNNNIALSCYSKRLFDIVCEYVSGNYAYDKRLDESIILQSTEFRKGIVDGWYATDGGNSNRIYTTSYGLVETGELLFTSLGINTIIDMSDRTGGGKVIIRGVSANRNYPVYCIRWYDMQNKRSMGDVYKVKNNTEYFKIDSITELSEDEVDDYVYCFEMKNQDEPYFTLPNGVITHNCRLRSDRNNEYFNTFGAGSTKIGSLGVVTQNFPRLAYYAKETENPKETFINLLQKSVRIIAKINHCKRNIIKKRIELNAMPLYTLGYMDLSKQYSTFGVNGLNEALETLGYDITSKDGEDFVIEILDTINIENDKMSKRFKNPHNVEQTPSESSAVKLAKRDRTLKYQDKYQLYSNQFIPLITSANMLDRLRLQGKFDSHFSGGAICHINVGEKIKDKQTLIDLMEYAAKCGVVYWAVNYALHRCEDDHVFVSGETCPVCGKGIHHTTTRVVGFFTNVANWNEVRRTFDWKNRQFYKGIES